MHSFVSSVETPEILDTLVRFFCQPLAMHRLRLMWKRNVLYEETFVFWSPNFKYPFSISLRGLPFGPFSISSRSNI